jgi:hypothetical protein
MRTIPFVSGQSIPAPVGRWRSSANRLFLNHPLEAVASATTTMAATRPVGVHQPAALTSAAEDEALPAFSPAQLLLAL